MVNVTFGAIAGDAPISLTVLPLCSHAQLLSSETLVSLQVLPSRFVRGHQSSLSWRAAFVPLWRGHLSEYSAWQPMNDEVLWCDFWAQKPFSALCEPQNCPVFPFGGGVLLLASNSVLTVLH